MEPHFEPYLYLGDVTATSALIAWGGFWFEQADGARLGSGARLVDDERLGHVGPAREDTIGARSAPYGEGLVEVFGPDGQLAGRAGTDTTNHVWVEGLQPDTDYTYRVLVDNRPWAEGERRDWRLGPRGESGLFPSGRRYDNRFRTFPGSDTPAPLSFAVLGDYGVGTEGLTEPARRQRQVAEALERAVREHDVRLLLTTGDNIYLGKATGGGTGDEDDNWFFTYYQPYRYVINRVPVYPAVGNHDVADDEDSDDRGQLEDNFFLDERFRSERAVDRASLDPGLFYRFGYGADVAFVAVDTSLARDLEERHYFEHPSTSTSSRNPCPTRGRRGDPGGGSRSPATPRTAPDPTTPTQRTCSSASSRCSSALGRGWSSAGTSTTSSTPSTAASTTSSPARAASCAASAPHLRASPPPAPVPGPPSPTSCSSTPMPSVSSSDPSPASPTAGWSTSDRSTRTASRCRPPSSSPPPRPERSSAQQPDRHVVVLQRAHLRVVPSAEERRPPVPRPA